MRASGLRTVRYRTQWSNIMGKYLIGWLLGVPAVVLVLLYLVFGA